MAENQPAAFFVGTAGAGKSSLVAAYDRWAKQHGLTTVTVNLDPGAEALPYDPDVDIRDYLRVDEIMEKHGLGPNGAQIAAADMLALNLTEVQDDMSGMRADQILIDTPGQLELFVFRQSGRFVVENLSPGSTSMVYLLDPFLALTASGFATQMLLAATTQFRIPVPLVPALTKVDRVEAESIGLIQRWAADPSTLEDDIGNESPTMAREMASHVTRLLGEMGLGHSLIEASAVDGSGLDDLYAALQAAQGQGEDATPQDDRDDPQF